MLEEIMQKLEDHAKDCEKLSNYCNRVGIGKEGKRKD